MHDVNVFRVQADADGLAHAVVVRGLNEPLEALELHDDVVVKTLEGNARDGADEMTLCGLHDVNVLRADDHVHRLVGGEPAVHTGELLAVHFHHVVADHGAV